MRPLIQLAAFVCAIWPLLAAANDSVQHDLRPALIGTEADSLVAVLICPSLPKANRVVVVTCHAHVQSSGVTRDGESYCYSPSGKDGEFVRATLNAIDRAVFKPARAGGANVPVYMPLRVVYARRDDECEITALPNAGDESPEAGVAYVAPQQILPEDHWYPRNLFHEFSRLSRHESHMMRTGPYSAVSVQVAEGGVATDGRVEANYAMSKAELKESKKLLESARYIPGFRAGRPTSMRYFEVFYGRE
ncbi:MAG: hypothetical protein AB7Q97_23460 [Gammaproteobacteria bacterium]